MALRISMEKILSPTQNGLTPFFEPREVAVIGSFREGFFGGYVAVQSMLRAGFKGTIYPVNPSYREVLGLTVYPSVKDIPGSVDLAVIIIGCRSVPKVMNECAEKGIKAAIVVSDGFAERDQEGVRLQQEMVDIAGRSGIRVIGPNTAGIANPYNGLIPNPYRMGYEHLRPGNIAICAQTGMINPQAFPYGDLHYGVSKICDFGNKSDVDECDLLEYLESDCSTQVITLYLESIRDGRKFLQVSQRVSQKKPVLILKSGRTPEGARVSASHTGSLAIDDRVLDGACRQAGVIRLQAFGELFELPKMFSLQPLPKGPRLGIVSFTGGIGVLAVDEGTKHGLSIPRLSSETRAKLQAIFPGLGETIVDIGPVMAVRSDYMSLYPDILKVVLTDDQIDCLLNVLWAGPVEGLIEGYMTFYKELREYCQKPVATWVYGPRLSMIRDLTSQLEHLGFPVFSTLEIAIKALGTAYQYMVGREGIRDDEGGSIR